METKLNNEIKISSNRNFGIVFFLVFLLIAVYPLTNNEEIKVWSVIISLIFLVLGLSNSKILTPLNKLWFKFGIFLGKNCFTINNGNNIFLSCNSNRFINEDIWKRCIKFKI